MSVYFVSRHPGAVEWAARKGIEVGQFLEHLNIDNIQAGDKVIGVLPLHLAAAVCARGARYLYLQMDLPFEARGQALSADDMESYGARIEEYRVEIVNNGSNQRG